MLYYSEKCTKELCKVSLQGVLCKLLKYILHCKIHCAELSVYVTVLCVLVYLQCKVLLCSVKCTVQSIIIQCTMYLTLHSFSLKLCSATIDL